MAYNPINLGPTTSANSQAVVLPSDQIAIPIIQTSSATVGGVTCATGADVGGTSSIAIVGSPAQIYGWYFYNANTVAAYVKIYNLVSGTTSSANPVCVLVIPPVGGANVFGIGITCSTAICITIAQGRSIGTAMPVAVDYNIFYK
jgi:hypothetical protein